MKDKVEAAYRMEWETVLNTEDHNDANTNCDEFEEQQVELALALEEGNDCIEIVLEWGVVDEFNEQVENRLEAISDILNGTIQLLFRGASLRAQGESVVW